MNVNLHRPEEPYPVIPEYLQEQIERDHLMALELQNEITRELTKAEKKRKRRTEYILRSSSKKKKSGKHSPRKQIKLENMLHFIPRKLY